MALFQLQPMTKNEENAIEVMICCDNFNRTRQLAILLFYVNISYLIIDFNNRAKGLWALNEAYYYVFHTHVVLGLVTLIYIILGYKTVVCTAQDITHFHRLYSFLFAFFALNYSAIISGWVSQEIHRPSNVYVIACFTIAVLFNFKSKAVTFLYGVSCAAFMVFLTLSQEDPYLSFGHYLDVFLLMVISYFLANVLYEFKQKDLLNKYHLEDIITERTKKLQAANDLLTKEIFERKRREIEMVRLDKMNIVGEMAASISHEVRNPMTTVKGFLQLLRDKQEPKAKEYFDIMIEELDRANAILSEFLSITRNKPTLMEWNNINDIVTSTLPLIQADAQNNDKLLKVELSPIPDLQLDIQEIRQLLLNLTRNGFEAMECGGQLTIRTFSTDHEVILVVADQGSGIEQSVLEKVGTPFFTTKEQGTGLGLAVCYGIVSRHNGSISVETSSEGTAFYVHFTYF